MGIGNELARFSIDAGPEDLGFNFFGDGFFLVDDNRQLAGGYRGVAPLGNGDFNGAGVAIAFFVDFDDGNDHLLEGCAAVDEFTAGTFDAKAVDRFGNLDLNIAIYAQEGGGEGVNTGGGLEVFAKDEAAVLVEDFALGFGLAEVAGFEVLPLVDKAMIGGN